MKRFLRFPILLLVLAGAFAPAVLPAAAQTCERCVDGWERVLLGGSSFCRAVRGEEVGVTGCQDGNTLFGPYCNESGGTFCNAITVDGGGGGGGSGGGWGSGGGCQNTGFCPAECFSCGTGRV